MLTSFPIQDEHVYFSDPRALHDIVVKNQYVFEETSMFIEQVAPLGSTQNFEC